MTIKISGDTGITYPDSSVAASAPANFVQVEEPHPDLVTPYSTWASLGDGLLKRRNAANTAWVTLGPLFDYHYTRGNIIGTVSQSGGVPTGALVQSGSNANGRFVRFADGTQIVHTNGVREISNGTTWTSYVFTYPAAFSAAPGVAVLPFAENSGWDRLIGGASTSVNVTFHVSAFTNDDFARFYLIAIGRWF